MKPLLKTYLVFVAAFALAASLAVAASADTRKGAAPRVKPGIGLSIAIPLQIKPASGVLKGVGHPDLVILPRYNGSNGLPGTGFCMAWNNGGNQTMSFYVRNTGSATVSGTHAQVSFTNGSFLHNIGALAPGQQRLVTQVIPPQAWTNHAHASASFMVTADPLEQWAEGNETNNYAPGTCIGPAT